MQPGAGFCGWPCRIRAGRRVPPDGPRLRGKGVGFLGGLVVVGDVAQAVAERADHAGETGPARCQGVRSTRITVTRSSPSTAYMTRQDPVRSRPVRAADERPPAAPVIGERGYCRVDGAHAVLVGGEPRGGHDGHLGPPDPHPSARSRAMASSWVSSPVAAFPAALRWRQRRRAGMRPPQDGSLPPLRRTNACRISRHR